MHIIAGAQRQRLQHGFVFAARLLAHIAGQRGQIGEDQVLFEAFPLGDNLSVGTNRQARSIEDQAVVAPHLVDHHDRNVMPLRDGREHLPAQRALVLPPR